MSDDMNLLEYSPSFLLFFISPLSMFTMIFTFFQPIYMDQIFYLNSSKVQRKYSKLTVIHMQEIYEYFLELYMYISLLWKSNVS